MNKRVKDFNQYLTTMGMNLTHQRTAIADAFFSTKGHVSTEELYRIMNKKHPQIGYSTVYRTLKLLSKGGLATERHFKNGHTRYEHIAEKKHHDHIMCLNCGKIVEFENKKIEELQKEIAIEHNFVIHDHKMELYGYCPKCR
ncbi:MAG: transcriptional repressor [Nitrospirota bacterium]